MNLQQAMEAKKDAAREIPATAQSFNELPALGHETRDVLKRLNSNLNYLEDLGGRLSFTLSEVRSLIRR
jgi:hypothetical protein